jgi:hypothetical protein
MGLSRKPTQRIKISYTGASNTIILPQIKYFGDKTRTVAKFTFIIRDNFGAVMVSFGKYGVLTRP